MQRNAMPFGGGAQDENRTHDLRITISMARLRMSAKQYLGLVNSKAIQHIMHILPDRL